MGDNYPNITLPVNEWVDLYTLSGITVGVSIMVENVGSADVYLAVQSAQPDVGHGSYNVIQRGNGIRIKNTIGDSGAWAYCNAVDGKVSVGETDNNGFYPSLEKRRFVDGNGSELFLEPNGGVPVNVQDQTSRPIDLRFSRLLNTTTLAADAVVNTYTVTLTAGHGAVAGNTLGLLDSTIDYEVYNAQILVVAGDVLTLDSPISYPFPTATTVALIATSALNVDGSVTPQVFPLTNAFDVPVDITRIILHITDASAMDDALFGGLPALTNGIVFRRNENDGTYTNYWNAKTNGRMGEIAYDARYDSKAPAGVYGFTAMFSYAGQIMHGVAIRILEGQAIELVVQDDLTGLLSFTITCQGHFTEGGS